MTVISNTAKVKYKWILLLLTRPVDTYFNILDFKVCFFFLCIFSKLVHIWKTGCETWTSQELPDMSRMGAPCSVSLLHRPALVCSLKPAPCWGSVGSGQIRRVRFRWGELGGNRAAVFLSHITTWTLERLWTIPRALQSSRQAAEVEAFSPLSEPSSVSRRATGRFMSDCE